VNLALRLESIARPAGTTVLSEATVAGLTDPPDLEKLPPQTVKGRESEVNAFRIGPEPEPTPD
jgi:class 3 adenylate cyclase